jgi:hypothetical protein
MFLLYIYPINAKKRPTEKKESLVFDILIHNRTAYVFNRKFCVVGIDPPISIVAGYQKLFK